MKSSPSSRETAGPAKRTVRLALAGSGLLLIGAVAAFYAASHFARGNRPAADSAIQVVLNGTGCEPRALTVPAGTSTFRIVNRSERVVEWEILDGVMVLEERENIAPGFSQIITARLNPGKYDITCGLLSNPRGSLTVTPTKASEAARGASPSLMDFIGPLAEYRVYLITQGDDLLGKVRELSAAIDAGDLPRAQALYARALLPYKHMESAAPLFSDLDTRIDGRADYFEKREQDPAFMGFHRIEYGLFGQHALTGLQAPAHRLIADVEALQARVRQLAPPPERLGSGAAKLMNDIATQKIAGDESPYAHADLSDFQGNLDGAQKIYSLLRAFVEKKDPALAGTIDTRFAATQAAMSAYRKSDGFISYTSLDAAARQALGIRFQALSVELGKVDPALGFN